MKLNASIAHIPLPPKMRSLPISPTGYPIPWFVATLDDGSRDFRIVEPGRITQAIKRRLCWLCGEPLGRHMAFVIGPMCAVNRVSSEPPSHRDCARYAVRACPFLTKPRMRRNDKDLPGTVEAPAGVMIERNPGVTLIWITESFHTFRPHGGGRLIKIGEPHFVEGYCEGRNATHAEVLHSIETGMPILLDMAQRQGPEAIAELDQQLAQALQVIENSRASWLQAAN